MVDTPRSPTFGVNSLRSGWNCAFVTWASKGAIQADSLAQVRRLVLSEPTEDKMRSGVDDGGD